MDKEMDVIVLPVALGKLRFEVRADLGEDGPQVSDGGFGQHVTAVFRDKDQVDMKRINNMSTSAIIHICNPSAK